MSSISPLKSPSVSVPTSTVNSELEYNATVTFLTPSLSVNIPGIVLIILVVLLSNIGVVIFDTSSISTSAFTVKLKLSILETQSLSVAVIVKLYVPFNVVFPDNSPVDVLKVIPAGSVFQPNVYSIIAS